MTDLSSRASDDRGIWSHRYRRYTAGLFVTILMAAVETYAVMAVAPLIATDLDAVDRYTWIFSAALLPQIVGTVVFARVLDRKGPAYSLLVGAALLGTGLVAASLVGSMNELVLARAMQGLGMGALINVVYASISLVLPDPLRPRAFALISAAYVLPAVGGPFLTGLLAEVFSWRAVFYGVLPLLAAAVLLVLPTIRRAGTTAPQDAGGTGVPVAVLLAIGVAVTSYGLTEVMTLPGAALAVLGLVLVGVMAWRALPSGVLTARPVRAGALATRGLTTAVFLGVETMVVYSLTIQHGLRVAQVGIAVSLSALTWALASWLQSRLDRDDAGAGRGRRMLAGVVVLVAAEALALSLPWWDAPATAMAVAIVSALGAGFGMGLAEPVSGTIALADTPEGESGRTASGMQLVDLVTPALGVAAAGSLINAFGTRDLRAGITAAIAAQLCLAVLAVLSAARLRDAGTPVTAQPSPLSD